MNNHFQKSNGNSGIALECTQMNLIRRAYEERICAIRKPDWWIIEILTINKTKNFSEWIIHTTRVHILHQQINMNHLYNTLLYYLYQQFIKDTNTYNRLYTFKKLLLVF